MLLHIFLCLLQANLAFLKLTCRKFWVLVMCLIILVGLSTHTPPPKISQSTIVGDLKFSSVVNLDQKQRFVNLKPANCLVRILHIGM